MESEIDLMRKNIRRLVENEIKPGVKDWEKKGQIPESIISRLSELGIFALTVPEEEGGIGYGATALTTSLEELARGSASVSLIVLLQNSIIAKTLSLAGEKSLLSQLIEGSLLGGGGVFDRSFDFQSNQLTAAGEFLIYSPGKVFVLMDQNRTYLLKDGIEVQPTTDVLAFHGAGIGSFKVESGPVAFS
ncbi:MAG TPA: acyl-CoA dehydrogenase family protein, partial [bacterium (Candidatus Stahlbacteria)]|nr:acyl-CoA dehydrogenase family protein [Candidatus Stahlbacteria bacterium]